MGRIAVVAATGAASDVVSRASRMGSTLVASPGGRVAVQATTDERQPVVALASSTREAAAAWVVTSMRDSADDVMVVVTGAIHNLAELAAAGEPVDAARAIAAGYRRQGPGFFRRLHGEFACVLYDAPNQRLYAVRDRFGTQLLFCAVSPDGQVAIASEIKALFAAGVSREPDWDTVRLYAFAHYRYAYGTDRTFFRHVRLLPPNAIWSIDLASRAVREEPLWQFEEGAVASIDDAEAIERYHALLETSLRRRRDTLTETPAFLVSGGLDSPTVAGLQSRRDGPVRAFSICYGDERTPSAELHYDERRFIEPTVEFHRMDWSAVYPAAAAFPETFDEMLRRHDEPISSPTWYAHYLLIAEIARCGHQVIFGGDGGDHALAGLYDDVPYYFADLKAHGDAARLDHELGCWHRMHDHPVFAKNRDVWQNYVDKCFDWNHPGRITGYAWDERMMRGLWPYERARHESLRSSAQPTPRFPSLSNRYLISKLHQDLLYSSSPPSNRAEDINLATFGVGLRSVLLDQEFMSFCWSLPGHLMIRDGFMKYLMRRAGEGVLPDVVRWKKDHVGLNAPANVWFRGELRPVVENAVRSPLWSKVPLFDGAALEGFLDEHMSERADHMMFLWRIVSLERWIQRWDLT